MTIDPGGSVDVIWDDDEEAYVARYGESSVSPSVAVAEAVTALRGEEGPPLFDYVDPDALDELIGSGVMTISFEIDGATVVLRDGHALVRPPSR